MDSCSSRTVFDILNNKSRLSENEMLSKAVLKQIHVAANGSEYAGRNITPIFPFLRARSGLTNDRTLRIRLDMIEGEFCIPNTAAWCKAFGHEPPAIPDSGPINGRFLFTDEEMSKEMEKSSAGVKK